MITTGKSITVKDDPLFKIKPEYLYHKLINPDTEVEAKIRQLRIVRLLDSRQYSQLKRSLPYVVCSIFNPSFRRTDNFAFTQYFIVDIDKISEKEMQMESLRQRLQADSRIMLSFLSPGEDGLKLMFKLKERCYDAGIYSIFYKMFVKQFSAQYDLEQVLDARTSDVARACFVSFDRNCYFNPDADTVDMQAFINTEDTSALLQLQKELQQEEKGIMASADISDAKGIPDDDALQKIRSLLNPKLKAKVEKKEAYVPDELNELMERLLPYLSESGITIAEIANISFGKKIRMKVNFREAEINLFYGKRGYSVVQSPRRGTDDELNGICADLIGQFLVR